MNGPLRKTIGELTGLRGRSCAGKIEYLTLSGARHALKRLRAESKAREPERLVIYVCQECPAWEGGPIFHIGHSSRDTRFFEALHESSRIDE